jgi:hypothetical protein
VLPLYWHLLREHPPLMTSILLVEGEKTAAAVSASAAGTSSSAHEFERELASAEYWVRGDDVGDGYADGTGAGIKHQSGGAAPVPASAAGTSSAHEFKANGTGAGTEPGGIMHRLGSETSMTLLDREKTAAGVGDCGANWTGSIANKPDQDGETFYLLPNLDQGGLMHRSGSDTSMTLLDGEKTTAGESEK